jgi:hypothetical protein
MIMSREKPQAQGLHKHPDLYQHDLNPDAVAGQNIGLGETQPAKTGRTAYDLKEAHVRLQHLSADDLKQIRILPEGSRLEQGATYLDLQHEGLGEFTATGAMQAGPGTWYVAKKTVPPQLWNRLRGVEEPERIGTTSAG